MRYTFKTTVRLQFRTPEMQAGVTPAQFQSLFEEDIRSYLGGLLAGAEEVRIQVDTSLVEARRG